MGIVSQKIVLWALLFMTDHHFSELHFLSSDLMCQQTEILEGDNISLKPKWKENINEIIWTLENNKVAEMNVNGKVRFFKHFEGRAQLNTHTGALNISMVQLKDGGTYICELIVNNGVILQTSIVLLVHPRLEAPQINCINENTAVDLTCETSSSEPITYHWNFQPCTTNSDDCELKDNNEMITVRNAISYMSQEVYCTVNNSLHSIRSESVLIRNCITDLRDRLWLVLLLFAATGAANFASFIIVFLKSIHRFEIFFLFLCHIGKGVSQFTRKEIMSTLVNIFAKVTKIVDSFRAVHTEYLDLAEAFDTPSLLELYGSIKTSIQILIF
ncbi:uncharacterized protein LOC122803148 [Protopterus annectens]|uniref:uncharacterized protein LOC122803148 n=1 Tax=Protopterus annectens TaxID=7888 RepID=UPI001CFC0756|nr:uncharacterized protein LOC122803148 [Protopterus annectens]